MPRPKKFMEPLISLHLRLPTSLHSHLRAEGERTNVSLNDLIVRRLSDEGGSFVTAGASVPPPTHPSGAIAQPKADAVQQRALNAMPDFTFETCPGHSGDTVCRLCGATREKNRFTWHPPA